MPSLIEVAFPVQAVSLHAAREKSIRHGHPSTLHLWWSRKPLAAARAVLMAQLLPDPGNDPQRFPTAADQAKERQRLLDLISETCPWDATVRPELMESARAELRAALGDDLPTVWDPFAGGGSLPLEAQRLGLPAVSSDVNPVAVTLQRVLMELPWRWGALDDVVEHWGRDILERARARLAQLYPPVPVQREDGPTREAPTAYLWVRTSPCASCNVPVPMLSNPWVRRGRSGQQTWLQPTLANGELSFDVRSQGEPPARGRGASFPCPACGTVTQPEQVRAGALESGLGSALRCAVVGSGAARQFVVLPVDQACPPLADIEAVPTYAEAAAALDSPLDAEVTNAPRYGIRTVAELHTPRQLAAMSVFADEVRAATERIREAEVLVGRPAAEAADYARDITIVLGLVLGRLANRMSTACVWNAQLALVEQTFIQNNTIALPWDFAEANPLSEASGSWSSQLNWVVRVLARCDPAADVAVVRNDARQVPEALRAKSAVITTDPPYFDYFVYSSLSDYFYLWQRLALSDVAGADFEAMLPERDAEIVRRSDDASVHDFTDGLTDALRAMRRAADPRWPMTLYYGYRTTGGVGGAPSGWESLLAALAESGWGITASWPIRTERPAGVKSARVSVAASIVLVLRAYDEPPEDRTWEQVQAEIAEVIPATVRRLQLLGIAPVDLMQAALGPGMALFTRPGQIVDAEGEAVSAVRMIQALSVAIREAVLDAAVAVDSRVGEWLGWLRKDRPALESLRSALDGEHPWALLWDAAADPKNRPGPTPDALALQHAAYHACEAANDRKQAAVFNAAFGSAIAQPEHWAQL